VAFNYLNNPRDDRNSFLAVTNANDETVMVFIGDKNGSFYTDDFLETEYGQSFIISADFNNDNIPDLAFSNIWKNTINVLLANDDATFQNKGTYNLASVMVSRVLRQRISTMMVNSI